jgi:hypothetical protein
MKLLYPQSLRAIHINPDDENGGSDQIGRDDYLSNQRSEEHHTRIYKKSDEFLAVLTNRISEISQPCKELESFLSNYRCDESRGSHEAVISIYSEQNEIFSGSEYSHHIHLAK